MIRQEQITFDNLDYALEVFHRIFTWMEPNVDPYSDVLKSGDPAKYYLVYDGDTLVGITGFYVVPEDPESAWLGWFGIVPEMRRNHYGSKILALHEETIKKDGYKYSRLYTEAVNNEATRRFYERNGYIAEDYDCPHEPDLLKGLFVTYSKSLGDYPLVPWNSRFMRIAETEKKFYTEEQLANIEAMIKAAVAAPHS